MQALSIRQPWAWLIVNGYQDVENRAWCAPAKGEIAIHTGKAFDNEGYFYVANRFPNIPLPQPETYFRGGVIGIAEHFNTVEPDAEVSPWHEWNFYGFCLRNARPIEPVPCRGQLGFFYVGIPEHILNG